MARRRRSVDHTPTVVSLLLLVTCISCGFVVVLHKNGYLDQAAFATAHRFRPEVAATTELATRTPRAGPPPRKGLSAVFALPGGRLAPTPCGDAGALLARSVEAE
ncbi:Galnt12 [Symbiodinium sp. CCMP2592]|nr:Galnt12 [Symbiodinium sp. CCMP2592]